MTAWAAHRASGKRVSFDEKLKSRVRDISSERPEILERKMFGGLCFLVAGKIDCGYCGFGSDGAGRACSLRQGLVAASRAADGFHGSADARSCVRGIVGSAVRGGASTVPGDGC